MKKEEIYENAGLGNHLGFGTSPALLVVDMHKGFTDPDKSPLAGNFTNEIIVINKLIKLSREKNIPIIFTVIDIDASNEYDAGLWIKKAPSLSKLIHNKELLEIDPRLISKPEDTIVLKRYPSAFFATNLSTTLTMMGIDTLIITGCTTSGCVRATVVDSMSHGFIPIIPITAVGDRALEPHESSLFDINSKYGDVLPTKDIINYLVSL
ncbi:MAG: isochorismatase family protein [bacterium]|nr:isochorismatase family protein [bacterium]